MEIGLRIISRYLLCKPLTGDFINILKVLLHVHVHVVKEVFFLIFQFLQINAIIDGFNKLVLQKCFLTSKSIGIL